MISKNKKYDINYLKESDLNEECTLEKLQKMCPFLTKDSPELYKLYLAQRPDLSQFVRNHYLKIIKNLEDRERRLIDEALQILKDVKEYEE